jgi:hypothetical protein
VITNPVAIALGRLEGRDPWVRDEDADVERQFAEARSLEAAIRRNLEGVGFGG